MRRAHVDESTESLPCAHVVVLERGTIISSLARSHSSAVVSDFIIRIRAERCRRPAMPLAVYRPCLRAFLLPLGAPGDPPPCIRQRPFAIAADRHC